jgi:hypothetical protein
MTKKIRLKVFDDNGEQQTTTTYTTVFTVTDISAGWMHDETKTGLPFPSKTDAKDDLWRFSLSTDSFTCLQKISRFHAQQGQLRVRVTLARDSRETRIAPTIHQKGATSNIDRMSPVCRPKNGMKIIAHEQLEAFSLERDPVKDYPPARD